MERERRERMSRKDRRASGALPDLVVRRIPKHRSTDPTKHATKGETA